MRQRHHSRRTNGAAWPLLCGLLLGLAQGCQPSGLDPAFDRYLGTLAAALSLKPPASQSGRVMPPPSAGSMQLGIAGSGLERIDIMTLRGCAVQGNVIRRDTSLGRAAKPSQQLLLALEYLRLAPPCIRYLQGRDTALAEQLRSAWQQQQAQLPALIFNATLGGDEFGAFWRVVPARGGYPRVSARETTAALKSIEALAHRWLQGDYRVKDRDFELWLAAVAGGTGGAQWQTLARRGDALAAADRMLQRRAMPAMRCGNLARGKRNSQPLIQLRTAFEDNVLPAYSRSLTRYRELQQPIAALETQLDAVVPPLYRRWMDERNQNLDTLIVAPRQHLLQFEQLLQACMVD
jgi:hypothetical protein